MRWLTLAIVAVLGLSPTIVLAAAIPLTKCQTIDRPGSYILSGNIFDSATSASRFCILVTAPDVTIDMNGFAMVGGSHGRRSGDTAIASASDNTITLLNGSISGFSNALDIAFYSRVDGVVVQDCSEGADVLLSMVSNSRFLDNRDFGIDGGSVIFANIATGNDIGIGTGTDGVVFLFNTLEGNSTANLSTGTLCPNSDFSYSSPVCVEYGNETQ